MDLNSPITELKGIGEKSAILFNKMGVYTVEDMLLFFPRSYIDYPQITNVTDASKDSPVALLMRLHSSAVVRKGRRMDITVAKCFAEDGMVECVWFRSPYIKNQLKVGIDYVFYGKIVYDGLNMKIEQPVIFTVEKYNQLLGNMQPLYHLTKGLNNNAVRKAVSSALSKVSIKDDRLPIKVISREEFLDYKTALLKYHFPESFDDLYNARRRLAYEELFFFILNSKLSADDIALRENNLHIENKQIVDETIKKLPFELTKGQLDTVLAIRKDMTSAYVTQRLVQGDVGSGKTMVAFLCMLEAVANGYQAAIMAPTEVLAMQHFETIKGYCRDFGLDYPVACLTGSMKVKERRENQKIIDENDAVFIVGTHALITEKSSFNNLAIVVTDEQHRFGVIQREIFSQKGGNPHIVVMSATPIPRTLAMIMYGNMNVSVISEMPSNRLPILTCVLDNDARNKAYKFIVDQVNEGHQAYVICPLVEASETTEAENVTDYADKLRNSLGDRYRIGLLHGKMKPAEKNEVMDMFFKHEIDILVSTTVVEVGVNVPNATVILIENANRFGLAQLHQLRGRVGRGNDQSYCILMNASKEDASKKRLDVVLKSKSGFDIAREDLRLRGPGDILGIRQSGDFDFKIADIIQDAKELEMAGSDVAELLEYDPKLEEHEGIKNALGSFLEHSNNIL